MDAIREKFREMTFRPLEEAKVEIEPDGTVELRWPIEGLTVLLTAREGAALVALLGTALAVGAPLL